MCISCKITKDLFFLYIVIIYIKMYFVSTFLHNTKGWDGAESKRREEKKKKQREKTDG